MKYIKTKLIFFVSAIFLHACSNSIISGDNCTREEGSTEERTLSIADFDSFTVNQSATIVVNKGLKTVKAKGKSNILSKITTQVTNKNWMISLGSGCIEYKDLSFDIQIPDLKKIDLIGSSDITVNGFKDSSDELTVSISGSGDVTLNGFSGKLNVSITGSGNVNLNDSSSKLEVTISGSGDINLKTFTGTIENESVTGTGKIIRNP